MRVWKAGAAAALMLTAPATQITSATAPEQVLIDRQVTPLRSEQVDITPQVFSITMGSRLGISIDDVDADDVKAKKLSSQAGVLIEDVDDDSPASKAGLKAGDVIVEFDGERVRSSSQLRRLIQETPAGRNVNVAVSRDGQRVSLTVTPQAPEARTMLRRFEATPRPPRAPMPPQPPRAPRAPRPPSVELFRDGFAYSFNGGRLGVTTQTLTDQLAKHFGVDGGVLVTGVTEDSAAAKAGLRAGDIITKVGSTSIDDSGDLMRAIGEASGEVAIEVTRDRKSQSLKATIEAERVRAIRRVM